MKYFETQLLNQGSLIPENTNPFYIFAPPYTRLSAGVKVLFSLCHYLNMLGEDAYLIPFPLEFRNNPAWPYYFQIPVHPWNHSRLNIKTLTQDKLQYHYEHGLTPICVMPEVYDNIFNAPFTVRYILNYPGLLAPKYKTSQDYTISYSKRLAEYVGSPGVLHIPATDIKYFYEKTIPDRNGACYYAGKYKEICGGKLDEVPTGSIEILRNDKMSIEKVREIFWHSKYFYCYEDSQLAIEASLCGCVVVFVPNDFFRDGPISSFELGNAGFAWGSDRDEILRAEASVGELRSVIIGLYRQVPEAILAFAQTVKQAIDGAKYDAMMQLPYILREVYLINNVQSCSNRIEKIHAKEDQSEVRESIGMVGEVIKRSKNRSIRLFLKNWILPIGIWRLLRNLWLYIKKGIYK